MPPLSSQACSRVIIDYCDPSLDRMPKSKLFRWLAGLLAIAATASATYAWWNRWGVNVFCIVAVAAAVGLTLRGWNRALLPHWLAWCVSTLAFGLWTILVLANQFHGRPPASDRYVMAGLAVCCCLSVIG